MAKPRVEKRRELRTVFSLEAYQRLEKQAILLDVTPSTWVRSIVMEKVSALEVANSSVQMVNTIENLQNFFSKIIEEEEKENQIEKKRK